MQNLKEMTQNLRLTSHENTEDLYSQICRREEATSDNTKYVIYVEEFRKKREDLFFKEVAPKKYSHASLDLMNFHPEELIDFGKKWAKNPRSLFLFGRSGCGKTHYVFALIRQLLRHGSKDFWPVFCTSPKLDSDLHNSLVNGGDRAIIEKMQMADVLIIDDFGRETKTERTRRQYFEILNERDSQYRPTILTSNYDLSWISREFNEAIASRLEGFFPVEFTGKDLRKQETGI